MMRIDLLLRKLSLVKSRSIAGKACDMGLVKINGRTAKASSVVAAGDVIEYSLSGYLNVLKIIDLPRGNVARNDTARYYDFRKREKLNPES